jgi:cyclopropane fatty-acyl-phospholipid synthase-like methyltransferase
MPSHYTYGTDPTEQERLAALNRLLNEACVAKAHLSSGERILDFGAGLGQLSRTMARVTGVPVVGIERSRSQIQEAERQAASDDESHLLESGKAAWRHHRSGMRNGALRCRPCPFPAGARP